jgi:hypothetical protein
MPQFDFYSFFNQIITTLSIFFIFYFVFFEYYIITFSKSNKIKLKLNDPFKTIKSKIDIYSTLDKVEENSVA